MSIRPLDGVDKFYLELIIKGLKTHRMDDPVKAGTIIEKLNSKFEKQVGVSLTRVRLKKLIGHIQKNSLLPVVESDKGYYITNDKDHLQKQIDKLLFVSSSAFNAASGLKKFLEDGESNKES